MKLSLSGMRSMIALILAAPMVPVTYLSVGGHHQPVAGSACATGASCMKCVANGCELGYNQALVYRGTYTFTRCVDFDGTPPGHCSAVMHNQFSIFDQSRIGFVYESGSCFKADCANGTIYQDRACDNPLYL